MNLEVKTSICLPRLLFKILMALSVLFLSCIMPEIAKATALGSSSPGYNKFLPAKHPFTFFPAANPISRILKRSMGLPVLSPPRIKIGLVALLATDSNLSTYGTFNHVFTEPPPNAVAIPIVLIIASASLLTV